MANGGMHALEWIPRLFRGHFAFFLPNLTALMATDSIVRRLRDYLSVENASLRSKPIGFFSSLVVSAGLPYAFFPALMDSSQWLVFYLPKHGERRQSSARLLARLSAHSRGNR